MKKTMFLSLALGLAAASPLRAATVDVYLTGSTAFRQNCFEAAKKLYVSSTPTYIYYGDTAHGGANSGFSSSTASWVMSGTPVGTLTNLSGDTLVVHGLFTGSIQGVQTVEQSVKLAFAKADGLGTANGLTLNYVTNTPTIAFSDASASVTPFPATGNYAEEDVAVLPFVVCKARTTGDLSNYVNNITWEQLEYGIPQGRIPLSAWSNKDGDDRTNKFVYLVERTSDSGTRRSETAQQYYGYGDQVGVYIYDVTNQFWYLPTSSTATGVGNFPFGVVGPSGLGNVNQNWGYGYVGGGNVAAVLNNNTGPNPFSVSNTSIGYLSLSDAKGVGYTNWFNVISFNGLWPTAAGAGIHGAVTAATNDFSPITTGYYPCWSKLVLVHIINPSANPPGDQNISQPKLGNNTTPGSFLGVFNAQTLIFTNLASPLIGSIENEIELSKTNSATAIRLSDMKSSRGSVGSTISPF